jgi:hypothetical protein
MRAIIVMLVLGLAITPGARAGDFTSGDWTWNVDDPEMFYAATENSAGQALIQLCDPAEGQCVYAVGFDTTCDKGDSYPALLNSDAGTASITLKCGGELDDGGNLMLVEDFDQMDRFVRTGKRIGFALPMQGDEFKAVRFSLKGSNEALDAMRKFAAKGSSKPPNVRNAKDSEVF